MARHAKEQGNTNHKEKEKEKKKSVETDLVMTQMTNVVDKENKTTIPIIHIFNVDRRLSITDT